MIVILEINLMLVISNKYLQDCNIDLSDDGSKVKDRAYVYIIVST